jgi:hypothetical protein
MRKAMWCLLLPLVLLVGAGCGSDPTVDQVRELRLAGQADSARALALSALEEKADRLPLWLEFVRANNEVCRESIDDTDPLMAEYCLQAALICAAMNQKKRPDKEWREAGKLISVEVGRQLNRVMNTFSSQMQTAALLKQMTEQRSGSQGQIGMLLRTEQLVDDYRDQARLLLSRGVIWRRILETLPELNPGISAIYGAELEQRQQQWMADLQLDPAYTTPVQLNARERADAGLARVQEDLNDLGYFLVNSVTENGVLP